MILPPPRVSKEKVVCDFCGKVFSPLQWVQHVRSSKALGEGLIQEYRKLQNLIGKTLRIEYVSYPPKEYLQLIELRGESIDKMRKVFSIERRVTSAFLPKDFCEFNQGPVYVELGVPVLAAHTKAEDASVSNYEFDPARWGEFTSMVEFSDYSRPTIQDFQVTAVLNYWCQQKDPRLLEDLKSGDSSEVAEVISCS